LTKTSYAPSINRDIVINNNKVYDYNSIGDDNDQDGDVDDNNDSINIPKRDPPFRSHTHFKQNLFFPHGNLRPQSRTPPSTFFAVGPITKGPRLLLVCKG
jgi:hypothetical protein